LDLFEFIYSVSVVMTCPYGVQDSL
jgi:hypothetical protein